MNKEELLNTIECVEILRQHPKLKALHDLLWEELLEMNNEAAEELAERKEAREQETAKEAIEATKVKENSQPEEPPVARPPVTPRSTPTPSVNNKRV